jgi:aquaporin Z
MLKYVVEFLGTLILLISIFKYGNALAIGLGLAIPVFLFGGISGGHFNPAVSFSMFLKGTLPAADLVKYLASQFLASAAVLQLAKVGYGVV